MMNNKITKKNYILKILNCCFLLILVGCNDEVEKNLCANVLPANPQKVPFLQVVNSPLIDVSSLNRPIGISCHNCYDNESSTAEDSLRLIEEALYYDVGLIELDIIGSNFDNFEPLISHEGDSAKVPLIDVISSPVIANTYQPLFIEIKGEMHSKINLRNLLRTMMSVSSHDNQFAYFNDLRFTVFRNLEDNVTLSYIRQVLEEEEFESIQPFVKLSRIYYPKPQDVMVGEIEKANGCGFHMVEFNQRIGKEDIVFAGELAQSLGLGVNVFTVDETNYHELIPGVIDVVDVLTVEGSSRNTNIEKDQNLFQNIYELLND